MFSKPAMVPAFSFISPPQHSFACRLTTRWRRIQPISSELHLVEQDIAYVSFPHLSLLSPHLFGPGTLRQTDCASLAGQRGFRLSTFDVLLSRSLPAPTLGPRCRTPGPRAQTPLRSRCSRWWQLGRLGAPAAVLRAARGSSCRSR